VNAKGQLTSPLSVEEQERFCRCEEIVEEGMPTFVEVGNALLEIRDSRLYRQDYSTFEEYCGKRWKMSGSHAHRLVDAARVVANLSDSPTGELPTSERQVRPLTQLESAEQQREAWNKAVEAADNGSPTAAEVQRAAAHEAYMRRQRGVCDIIATTPPRKLSAREIERKELRSELREKCHQLVELFNQIDTPGEGRALLSDLDAFLKSHENKAAGESERQAASNAN